MSSLLSSSCSCPFRKHSNDFKRPHSHYSRATQTHELVVAGVTLPSHTQHRVVSDPAIP